MSTPAPSMPLQCMEVWGGNRSADTGLSFPGIDVWVFSRPHGGAESGGDVHYFSSCATGRIFRLLVADASGHGEKASHLGVALRDLMRRNVNHLNPTRIVKAMNEALAEGSARGSFATALVVTYFAPTRDLTVSNAGHLPPLLYRSGTHAWSLLERKAFAMPREGLPAPAQAGPADLPLGVLEETRYEQLGLGLEPGDLLLCYTDSLSECRDPSGRLVGPRGLLELVRSLDPANPQALIPGLLGKLWGLAPGNLAQDDVTALLLRPNGARERPRLRDRLLAPIRILGAIPRALGPRGEAVPWPDWSLPNVAGALVPWFQRLWSRRNRKLG